MDRTKVRAWLESSNGYAILAPEFFGAMGLKLASRRHASDPSLGKHAATRSDGKPGDVGGVSEFSAVYAVARELGVDLAPHSNYSGRGRRYASQVAAILAAL